MISVIVKKFGLKNNTFILLFNILLLFLSIKKIYQLLVLWMVMCLDR